MTPLPTDRRATVADLIATLTSLAPDCEGYVIALWAPAWGDLPLGDVEVYPEDREVWLTV